MSPSGPYVEPIPYISPSEPYLKLNPYMTPSEPYLEPNPNTFLSGPYLQPNPYMTSLGPYLHVKPNTITPPEPQVELNPMSPSGLHVANNLKILISNLQVTL